MSETNSFKWPEAPWPEQAWWEIEGSALNMSDELIRFTAALATLGGTDSRSNSRAAALAGMKVSRTMAFRYARSVAVKKLLTKAEQIKSGKRKPLTESEIDDRLAEMVRSANDVASVRAIELLDKRKSALGDTHDGDPMTSAAQLLMESGIAGAPFLFAFNFHNFGNPGVGSPLWEWCAPIVKSRFPELWQQYRKPILARYEFFKDRDGEENERGQLEAFDAAGDGPQLSDEEFRARVKAFEAANVRNNRREHKEWLERNYNGGGGQAERRPEA